ncbi:MAG TPA: WD40 repeat domain-containing protein, partial [Candidatus Hodarchaeales archaeon]|nr:WD40 repeat domain-containing protein [Candidatus Hodarchaeales archaeon]
MLEHFFVTGSTDRTVRLWNNIGEIVRIINVSKSKILSIDCLADGKTLAIGGSGGLLRLYDAASGLLYRELSSGIEPGHTNDIRALAVMPGGKFLASAGFDKKIIFWDWESGKVTKTFIGHTAGVVSLDISYDGRFLLSGSIDKRIILWDIESAAPYASFAGHSGVVTSVRFLNDKSSFISGSEDKSIRIWDLKTGILKRTIPLAGAEHL